MEIITGFCPPDTVSSAEAMKLMRTLYPDLHPLTDHRGNGPARYYGAAKLKGTIGLIDSMSHQFCSECNRVRLTATGALKTCLCYPQTVDLKAPLRQGESLDTLRELMRTAISKKPAAHCFSQQNGVPERAYMSQIGG